MNWPWRASPRDASVAAAFRAGRPPTTILTTSTSTFAHWATHWRAASTVVSAVQLKRQERRLRAQKLPPAVALVVEPLALKNISIDVPKFTLSTSFVKSPISFVFGAVLPDLASVTVFQIAEPLANICCAIFKMNFWSFLQLRLIYLLHVKLVVKLTFEHIIATHVVVMLWIQFTQLSSNSLSGNNASCPRLQSDYQEYVFLKIHLIR